MEWIVNAGRPCAHVRVVLEERMEREAGAVGPSRDLFALENLPYLQFLETKHAEP
jgi:hypothetical protein